MSELDLVETRRVFSKLKSEASAQKVPRYPEEYVALLEGVVVGHSRSRETLLKQLRMRGINPKKVKIEKARIKLIL